MSRLYVQLDQDFGTNLKLGKVGALATLVLLHLDALHHKEPADGLVSNGRASAASLAVGLGAFRDGPDAVTRDDIEAALARLAEEGLIEIRDDGSVYLPRWKDWSGGAMTGAERTRKWREKRKGVTSPRRHRDESDVAEQSRAEQRTPERVTNRRHTQGGSAAHTGDRNQSAGPPAPNTYEDTDPVIDAILTHGFRSKSKRRKAEARRIAENILQCGHDAASVQRLWDLAENQGEDPPALFTHWLSNGLWREVLDEEKRNQRLKGRATQGD